MTIEQHFKVDTDIVHHRRKTPISKLYFIQSTSIVTILLKGVSITFSVKIAFTTCPVNVFIIAGGLSNSGL